ncbi:hypothetical protein [Clostridium cellulovorans]|uniref:Putative lipoprotein n=1 Tax=Clostridium cellulovorans (strain ATCC 35296 / DSM 3052 / OCM 3 / 743B) TaxID=573061 RepID=D9SST7_CLOC7|nr:hypothetical protein [Clostridium cellulovorans]ADL52599.1 putative lipoprotein [Clostridium cellulovorans 743B]
MNGIKKMIFIFIIVSVICGYWFYNKNSFLKEKKESPAITLETFDNIYDGKYIKFYYDNLGDINLEKIKTDYKLEENVKMEGTELDKILSLSEFLSSKLQLNKKSSYNTEDISTLISKSFSGQRLNAKDYNIIFANFVKALGFQSRVLELYQNESKKETTIFSITEIYIPSLSKWMAFDSINKLFFAKGEDPLSAIEVIEQGLSVVDLSKEEKNYVRDYGKYFNNLRMQLDNSYFTNKKSNSYIMYLKEDDEPQLIINTKPLNSTIYTHRREAFMYAPTSEGEIAKEMQNFKDVIPTLILTLKNSEKKLPVINGAAFKDSVNVKNYYIRIDDGQWGVIDNYFTITLNPRSKTKIQLSLDGNTVLREIVISNTKG